MGLNSLGHTAFLAQQKGFTAIQALQTLNRLMPLFFWLNLPRLHLGQLPALQGFPADDRWLG